MPINPIKIKVKAFTGLFGFCPGFSGMGVSMNQFNSLYILDGKEEFFSMKCDRAKIKILAIGW